MSAFAAKLTLWVSHHKGTFIAIVMLLWIAVLFVAMTCAAWGSRWAENAEMLARYEATGSPYINKYA